MKKSCSQAPIREAWPSWKLAEGTALDGSVRDIDALHMGMLERACHFDLLHFHLDYYPFSLFSRQSTPFVTTLHGRTRPAGASGSLRDIFLYPCDLDLRRSTTARAQGRIDPHNPPRLAGAASNAEACQARLLCLSRAHLTEELSIGQSG